MIKKLIVLLIVSISTFSSFAQDSLSTIIFYREAKFAGSAITYKIMHDSIFVGKMELGARMVYKCKPGLLKFWAHTESKNFIIIEAKAGETYYIECSVGVGALVGTPAFRQVRAATAQPALREITRQPDLVLKGSDELIVLTSVDTVGAVSHLFQRKRKGGNARALIFGGFGLINLFAVIGADDENTSSGAGYALSFAIIGIGVTGLTQASKYGEIKLETLLKDYQKTRKLPVEVREKLKKKDFE